MTELAGKTGISRAGLYKALSPEGNPSLETVQSVLRAMGMRLAIEAIASDDEEEENA